MCDGKLALSGVDPIYYTDEAFAAVLMDGLALRRVDQFCEIYYAFAAVMKKDRTIDLGRPGRLW